jgi:hypothetical protein
LFVCLVVCLVVCLFVCFFLFFFVFFLFLFLRHSEGWRRDRDECTGVAKLDEVVDLDLDGEELVPFAEVRDPRIPAEEYSTCVNGFFLFCLVFVQ